jgi:hypothetical protein
MGRCSRSGSEVDSRERRWENGLNGDVTTADSTTDDGLAFFVEGDLLTELVKGEQLVMKLLVGIVGEDGRGLLEFGNGWFETKRGEELRKGSWMR